MNSLCWFRSYLTGRVHVTDSFINDMSAAIKCMVLLYVDDSVLLASGRDLVGIEATLSSRAGFIKPAYDIVAGDNSSKA